jgi:thiamine-monophosphate kinase
MSLGEFDIIERFFAAHASRADVRLGIGDDAAVMDAPANRNLVLAMDTLVEGVHFLANTDAFDIGHRALAVNLSDLAAMGAMPSWMSLSLSLPHADAEWLEQFAAGLFSLAKEHDVQLIGGDTVRGPLVITLQVGGWIEPDRWLTRGGAKPGDHLYVSGNLGDAAAGLEIMRAKQPNSSASDYLLERFLRPQPRVALGRQLRNVASAAMDVSDGLIADAGKLCKASGCGVTIDADLLPLSNALRECFSLDRALQYAMTGGDDYELIFTVPERFLAQLDAVDATITRIGIVDDRPGVRCTRNGRPLEVAVGGYDHFASSQ